MIQFLLHLENLNYVLQPDSIDLIFTNHCNLQILNHIKNTSLFIQSKKKKSKYISTVCLSEKYIINSYCFTL